MAKTEITTCYRVRLWAALNNLLNDLFIGLYNLLFLTLAIQSAEIQGNISAWFHTINYYKQFVIMYNILLEKMVQYKTMAFECWNQVNNIKA